MRLRAYEVKGLRSEGLMKRRTYEAEHSQERKGVMRTRKFVNYYSYIRSGRWRRVRRERLRIDGFKCAICGARENLQVHHMSYERLGQTGEIFDLITLCRECHAMIHGIKTKAV